MVNQTMPIEMDETSKQKAVMLVLLVSAATLRHHRLFFWKKVTSILVVILRKKIFLTFSSSSRHQFCPKNWASEKERVFSSQTQSSEGGEWGDDILQLTARPLTHKSPFQQSSSGILDRRSSMYLPRSSGSLLFAFSIDIKDTPTTPCP